MKAVKIFPTPLHGKIKIPPSKSISHRLLICGALAEGETILKNISFSEDILASKDAVLALGANIEELRSELPQGTNDIRIKGNGQLYPKQESIDCRESGSTLRFLIPIAALTPNRLRFTGRPSLAQRPLSVFSTTFKEQKIYFATNQGGLPATVQGPLQPGHYKVRGDISSQFVSGLLFALPLLDQDSVITIDGPIESKGYLDLTIDALKKFAISIENNNYKSFNIKGQQRYQPTTCTIEGDFSQAAFWLVAGLLGREITCLDLNNDSKQGDRIILDILTKMGGQIAISDRSVRATPSPCRGLAIDASECPDLVPILATLGALSQGTTNITNAQRLRIKESDRLQTITSELKKLGANLEETNDGLIITGQPSLTGGVVDSHNDHRIAMALAVAALRCEGPVTILKSESVNKSYPTFWRDYDKLGGNINEFPIW